MKFLLPFAVVSALAGAVPAIAQGLPASAFCGTIDSSTGLGDGGFACHTRTFSPTLMVERLWLITGTNPAPIVTVTFGVEGVTRPPPNARGYCVATPAWTMPEYAEGYPIPEWPLAFVDQSAYDNVAATVTMRVRILDPVNGLQPVSNYSLDVVCASRSSGP